MICIHFVQYGRTNSHAQNLDRAVSTGGSGDHGITNPNGPDALFAQVSMILCAQRTVTNAPEQGSVKASAKGQVLAAVNVSDRVGPIL